ncbi:MAG TPA: acyl-CoA dehydrogenase family protein [Actinomycetota bacterium]|nr:acyl-CoA dehydrogenase family protein [Actinomycetota bacterium]
MDFELDEHERALRDLCREFAQAEIAPNAQRWWDEERCPTEVLRKMGELGLMGLLVPERYGGAGCSTVGFVAAMEEVGRADQSVAAAWQAHLTIGSLPLLHFGTEAQKERWLVPLARGEALGAFGLTEPEAGSDASAVRTRARRVGDGWVLDGRKMFISNAGTDMSFGVTVLARLEDGAEGARYANFVVPRGTPGYSWGEKLRGIGWRALDTRALYFDHVHLADDCLLGTPGEGLAQFLSILDVGRISIAALSVSLAQAVLDLSLEYAKRRVQFGQPIARYQAIQFKLADIATELEAARWLTYRAATLRDAGRPYTKEAAMAKLKASRVAVAAASEAVQVHGGYGYMLETPVARFYCDAKVLEIGEGTNEIQHIVIAKELGC